MGLFRGGERGIFDSQVELLCSSLASPPHGQPSSGWQRSGRSNPHGSQAVGLLSQTKKACRDRPF